jgi:hypothetical protein
LAECTGDQSCACPDPSDLCMPCLSTEPIDELFSGNFCYNVLVGPPNCAGTICPPGQQCGGNC